MSEMSRGVHTTRRFGLWSRGRHTAQIVAAVISVALAAAAATKVVNHYRRVHDQVVRPGTSGLPAPETVQEALGELARRLHRVPDLALIELAPGKITFQYYAKGRDDRGSFIDWQQGRLGTPRPFTFPGHASVPQLRFDPAELRLDGVVSADRLRASVGLGGWQMILAQGFRRGAPISDGSGLVWRITVARGDKQAYLFTNQGGEFLRIARIPTAR
jgi:hypothetical protein